MTENFEFGSWNAEVGIIECGLWNKREGETVRWWEDEGIDYLLKIGNYKKEICNMNGNWKSSITS